MNWIKIIKKLEKRYNVELLVDNDEIYIRLYDENGDWKDDLSQDAINKIQIPDPKEAIHDLFKYIGIKSSNV